MILYTNENDSRLGNRLLTICKNTDLYIATAFFSNYDFIKNAIMNGCNIKLIVRLGGGTDHDKLLKILDDTVIKDNINIRYYACNEYHPKFYIIENLCAIIGSSNLTKSGLLNNKEVNIEIEAESPIYEELMKEFEHEWNNAKPISREIIIKTKDYCEQYELNPKEYHNLYNHIGEVKVPNITTYIKKDKMTEYTNNFRSKYQEYIKAVNRLIKIYLRVDVKRRYAEELPIRIEIDRFLSWIKDSKFKGEEYLNIEKKSEDEIENDIRIYKREFLDFEGTEYYNDTENRYAKIVKRFSTKEAINNSSKMELLDTLLLINAINEQLRYYNGGLETMKNEFMEITDENKLKATLNYLFYGDGDYVNRIYEVDNFEEYKIKLLGRNSLTELYGYVNNEEIPTCNQRMLHSMQWLGFGKF